MRHYTERPTPNEVWVWLQSHDVFEVYPEVVITHRGGFYWINDTVRFVSVVKAIDTALSIADAPYQAAMRAKLHTGIPDAIAKGTGRILGLGLRFGVKATAWTALKTAEFARITAQATLDGLDKKKRK